MKRSRDSIEPTSLKRSDSSDLVDLSDGSNHRLSFLYHQNKSMGVELRRRQRQITELDKEVQCLEQRKKSLDSLVSLLDRSWSQLDIDAMLITSVIDNNINQGASQALACQRKNEIFCSFLDAGSKFLYSNSINDPQDASAQLCLDNWSSAEDLDREKARLCLQLRRDFPGATTEYFESRLNEDLIARTAFTKAILEKCCAVLTNFVTNPKIVKNLEFNSAYLEGMKKLTTENMALRDKIMKQKADLLELSLQVHLWYCALIV